MPLLRLLGHFLMLVRELVVAVRCLARLVGKLLTVRDHVMLCIGTVRIELAHLVVVLGLGGLVRALSVSLARVTVSERRSEVVSHAKCNRIQVVSVTAAVGDLQIDIVREIGRQPG